ncbi:helix-turn-helix domain-containing protein [Streptococcus sanguinis]|jgi:transcriptional regulator with XRE-family HTH domain|uniref:helix-turn-helix domain-containing protein n=1 Tax=Streptococcus sanguinis TaxID=1305 RepID=UPI001CBDF554|nr:helix-turn-helix transcriptional regulator [Streptococcus sanguinis]DAX64624.1 MAG TPA: repressor protein [Caudoviricetes sp.]MBZ2024523.1 helix-turn-helix domain-containing protein [Streptococcus sanguinis]MBZ2049181.1 helix-turn-helix domain-containing protein [Streptococcus sanguinis]MBZ2051304.1 helix-turn-helix domain-containing protein [Streptococcus sanguinis]MBZ2060790.1 helix-turn-helix domain-containing protein [Streptococcus sanguinis]
MFLTFERIKELAKKRGLSLNQVEEKLGYSKNTLYSLKRQKVSSDRLQEIADYFGVSTDYLLGRTDNPAIAGEKAPEHEIELDDLDGRIMLFDGKPLSDDDKRAIKGIIEGYLNSKK